MNLIINYLWLRFSSWHSSSWGSGLSSGRLRWRLTGGGGDRRMTRIYRCRRVGLYVDGTSLRRGAVTRRFRRQFDHVRVGSRLYEFRRFLLENEDNRLQIHIFVYMFFTNTHVYTIHRNGRKLTSAIF